MIDLKSKILLSKDPTPENIQETLELAKSARLAGFNKLIATPSFVLQNGYSTTHEYNMIQCNHINSLLKDNKIDVQVYLGNEISYTPEVIGLLKDSKISTINNTKYVLLNFDKKHINFYAVIDSAFKLQIAGYIPIISHIERYNFIIENYSIVEELILRDILIQIDVLSITGLNGDIIKKTTRDLLKNNMVHVLGTDASKPEHYDQSLNALNRINKIVGKIKFEEISTTNGEHILNNELVKLSNNTQIKRSLFR